jgi:hypothetical protein
MFSFEHKTSFAMIECLLIKKCYAGIKTQMFFMAGYTLGGSILKVIPMFRGNRFFNFSMAFKTFSPGDFFSLLMTLTAIWYSLQLFMRAREFSRRNLCLQDTANT